VILGVRITITEPFLHIITHYKDNSYADCNILENLHSKQYVSLDSHKNYRTAVSGERTGVKVKEKHANKITHMQWEAKRDVCVLTTTQKQYGEEK
jgi:hypothetical protein